MKPNKINQITEKVVQKVLKECDKLDLFVPFLLECKLAEGIFRTIGEFMEDVKEKNR